MGSLHSLHQLRSEAPETTGTALQPLKQLRQPNQNQIISFFSPLPPLPHPTTTTILLVLRETITSGVWRKPGGTEQQQQQQHSTALKYFYWISELEESPKKIGPIHYQSQLWLSTLMTHPFFFPPYSFAFFHGVVKMGGKRGGVRISLLEDSAKLTLSPDPLVVVCLDYKGYHRRSSACSMLYSASVIRSLRHVDSLHVL